MTFSGTREIREDEEAAGRFPGGFSAELHVGDLVMIRYRRLSLGPDQAVSSRGVGTDCGKSTRRCPLEPSGLRMLWTPDQESVSAEREQFDSY